MIREKITTKDYERISKENEYYIWHFTMTDELNRTVTKSIFSENNDSNNIIPELLDIYDIPYYESEIKNSLDFLDMIGIPIQQLWIREYNEFKHFILAFKRKRLIASTLDGYCMCPEGITELLLKLNPEIVLNAKLD